MVHITSIKSSIELIEKYYSNVTLSRTILGIESTSKYSKLYVYPYNYSKTSTYLLLY